jgi:hypothetical protein
MAEALAQKKSRQAAEKISRRYKMVRLSPFQLNNWPLPLSFCAALDNEPLYLDQQTIS